ncbi:GAK system XXXCH domain-containing protein [Desulfonatronospira sp.]|uniref:GAK system XXXCH domain-containing protein n=1 Tax=Desulfonatronospira sp. TaxID=1962951 RepID=UPI0025C302AB|nr:GAK system XXXCH domain-containing protein [Desulfonatronospira sp.]
MKTITLNTRIDSLIQDILQYQNENQMPSFEEVQEFVRAARTLPMHADESWLAEAEDFSHLADQLLLAVKNSQFEEAVQLMDSIREAWTFIAGN